MLFGTSAVTFYTVPAKITDRMPSMMYLFSSALYPLSSEAVATGRLADLRTIYFDMIRILLWISALLGTLVIVLSKDILTLWIGPEFMTRSWFILVLLAAGVIWRASGSVAYQVCNGMGRADVTLVASIGTALSITIPVLIFAPRLGPLGIALGVLIGLIISNVAYDLYTQRRVLGCRGTLAALSPYRPHSHCHKRHAALFPAAAPERLRMARSDPEGVHDLLPLLHRVAVVRGAHVARSPVCRHTNQAYVRRPSLPMTPAAPAAGTTLVSVVIPTLNRAHYLPATIESVLNQDYACVECIAVDGGSRDESVAVLRRYDDRIKWVSEPDQGHADAINKGWHMSSGAVVSWLNADDLYVAPAAISTAVAYMETHADVDVLYGDYSEISEDGRVLRGPVKPPSWDLADAVKFCRYTVPQAASFIRRSILERVGWLDAAFGNGKDHELWLRIGMIGTIRYAPIHIAYVRKCRGLSQRLDMGQAKIRITQRFFLQPHLRPPFDSPRFKRRAFSNSYLVAGIYTWNGTKQIAPTLAHLRRSVTADPLNSLFILKTVLTRASLGVLSFLPERWQTSIKTMARRIMPNLSRATAEDCI